MLKVYNTITRRFEEFVPIHQGNVGFYVCGPTVYDHCHLGHARGYVSMDVLRRYLEYQGLEVRHIMNYTDVGHLVDDAETGEDKIEKKAKKEKVDPMAIVEKYIASAEKDFAALAIKPAHFNPRPTQYISQIIKFVEELIKKGFAYEANGSVYFSVEKFPEYGKLSGRKKEELEVGARVEANPEKRNPLDFALWIKASKEHILKWESPWSVGYPGWHIECSVMSSDLLGQDTFDIHGGGVQNVFPHNENEIAQSEAYLGKKMANFWVLWGNVNMNGEKMSKSLGNQANACEAIEKYGGAVVRLWVLSSQYRSIINYTEESLEQAKTNFHRIENFVFALRRLASLEENSSADLLDLENFRQKFEEAMDDDLNTPVALAVIFELITATNKATAENKLSFEEAKKIMALWEKMNQVFGLEIKEISEEIPEEALRLAKEREIARTEKDFLRADELRLELQKLGYAVEDKKNGGYEVKKI